MIQFKQPNAQTTMSYGFSPLSVIREQIEQETNLKFREPTADGKIEHCGSYTTEKFKLQIKEFADKQLAVSLTHNHSRASAKGGVRRRTAEQEERLKQDILDSLALVYAECLKDKKWDNVNNNGISYQYTTSSVIDLARNFLDVHKWLTEKGYFEAEENTGPASAGVSFEGTQFNNATEKHVTGSGMFHALICDAIGTNQRLFRAEYPVRSGNIDIVEFDKPNGNVITLIECQHGIQKGEFLDHAHYDKLTSRYLHGGAHANTVKTLVYIAGGFTESQKRDAQEFIDKHPQYTLYLLRTDYDSDGNITLVVDNTITSDEELPRYRATKIESTMDITEIVDRLNKLEAEQFELKTHMMSLVRERPSLMGRLFKS